VGFLVCALEVSPAHSEVCAVEPSPGAPSGDDTSLMFNDSRAAVRQSNDPERVFSVSSRIAMCLASGCLVVQVLVTSISIARGKIRHR
jgi:hypothetical protein